MGLIMGDLAHPAAHVRFEICYCAQVFQIRFRKYYSLKHFPLLLPGSTLASVSRFFGEAGDFCSFKHLFWTYLGCIFTLECVGREKLEFWHLDTQSLAKHYKLAQLKIYFWYQFGNQIFSIWTWIGFACRLVQIRFEWEVIDGEDEFLWLPQWEECIALHQYQLVARRIVWGQTNQLVATLLMVSLTKAGMHWTYPIKKSLSVGWKVNVKKGESSFLYFPN